MTEPRLRTARTTSRKTTVTRPRRLTGGANLGPLLRSTALTGLLAAGLVLLAPAGPAAAADVLTWGGGPSGYWLSGKPWRDTSSTPRAFTTNDWVVFGTDASVGLSDGVSSPDIVPGDSAGARPALTVRNGASVNLSGGSIFVGTNGREFDVQNGATLNLLSSSALAGGPLTFTNSAGSGAGAVTIAGTVTGRSIATTGASNGLIVLQLTGTSVVGTTSSETDVYTSGTTVANGTIYGRVFNAGTWTGSGTIARISSSGQDAVRNRSSFTMAGTAGARAIIRGNVENVDLGGPAGGDPALLRLSLTATDVTGAIATSGTASLTNSTVSGLVSNSGKIAIANSTLSDGLSNSGTATLINNGIAGTMTNSDTGNATIDRGVFGLLINEGQMTMRSTAAGLAPIFVDQLRNSGQLTINSGDFRSGAVTTGAGAQTVFDSSAAGSLARGDLTVGNQGKLQLKGGTLNGKISTTSGGTVQLVESTRATNGLGIASGSSLDMDATATGDRTFSTEGVADIAGDIKNTSARRLTIESTAGGAADNIVLRLGSSTITGSVLFKGNVAQSGAMSSALTGPLTVQGQLRNTSQLFLGSGSTTTITNVVGTAPGLLINDGTLESVGTINGAIQNTSTARLSGVVSGNVENTDSSYLVLGHASPLAINGAVTSGGTVLLGKSAAINGTLNVTGGTATLDGAAAGDHLTVTALTNAGKVVARDLDVTSRSFFNTGTGIVELSGTTKANLYSADADTRVRLRDTLQGAAVLGGNGDLSGTITGALYVGSGVGPGAGGVTELTGNLNAGAAAPASVRPVQVRQNGTLRVGSGSNRAVTLTATLSEVAGNLDVFGTVAGNVAITQTGAVSLSGGTSTAAQITGNADVQGQLNLDRARIAGLTSVGSTGNVNVLGNSVLGRLLNTAGGVRVGSGATLTLGAPFDNGGKFDLYGTLGFDPAVTDRTLTNSGTVNVIGGTLAGNLTNTNLANLNNATITGTLTNTAAATALNLSGTTNAALLANAGAASIDGVLSGGVTNSGKLLMGSNADVRGGVVNAAGGDVTLGGTTTTITNAGTMRVGGGTSATATGAITNGKSLNVAGTLNAQGGLTNNDALSVGGTLNSAGTVVNNKDLSLGGTLAISGGGTALQNNAAATATLGNNAKVVGSVANDGTIKLWGAAAGVIGNFTNNGTVTNDGASVSDTGLSVSGDFVNNKLVASANGKTMTITAATITNAGTLSGSVFLNGATVNTGTLSFLDPSRMNGALVNKSVMSVAGTLDGAGHILTNQGTLTVTGGGNVAALGQLVNEGTAAITGRVQGDVVNRATITGSGSFVGGVTNSGTMSARTVTGNLLNQTATGATTPAKAVLSGALSGSAVNTGSMSVGGGITGGADNRTGADLTVTGNIGGDTNNAGTAKISGRIGGNVTNSNSLIVGAGIAGNTINSAGGTLAVTGDIGKTLRNDGVARVSGQVGGDAINTATGTLVVSGRVAGALANSGNATVQGGVATDATNSGLLRLGDNAVIGRNLQNSGALAGLAGGLVAGLRVGSLSNSGTASLLNLTGDVRASGGTTALSGTTRGNVVSTGVGTVLAIGGGVTGEVVSGGRTGINGLVGRNLTVTAGSTEMTGNLTVTGATRVNAGTLGVGNGAGTAAETLTATGGVAVGGGTDAAALVVRETGTINGTLAAGRNARVTNLGTISGRTDVLAGGSLISVGRIGGPLVSAGTTSLAGSVGGVVINNGGKLDMIGRLSATGVNNLAGQMSISRRAGSPDYDLDLGGGVLSNASAGRLTLREARINGNLGSAGLLEGSAAVTGNLVVSGGTATLTGPSAVGGTLETGAKATMTAYGPLAARAINNTGNLTAIGALSATTTISNSNRLAANGDVSATRLANTGWVRLAKGMTGALEQNAGTAIILGNVTGGVTLNGGTLRFSDPGTARMMAAPATRSIAPSAVLAAAPPGPIDLGSQLTVRGTLDVDSPTYLRALKTSIAGAGRINVAGRLDSDVTNSATLALARGGRIGASAGAGGNVVNTGAVMMEDGSVIAGTLTNSGPGRLKASGTATLGGLSSTGADVDLANGSSADRLVIGAGGLNGGNFRLDLNAGSGPSGLPSADLITVNGGKIRGTINITFNTTGSPSGQIGERVQFLKSKDGTGHSYTLNPVRGLPTVSERIIYGIYDDHAGNAFVVSDINPAIGGISGNITLTQSLIGSIVNRPTSPMVGGLASGVEERPCGPGGWARAIGGRATADGSTSNRTGSYPSRIEATYRGLQMGGDLACFGGHYSGWDMAFGALIGVNDGTTSQPVYGVSKTNASQLTDQITSNTDGDFRQVYGGVYLTASKGELLADLQLRREHTDFTLTNKPVPGAPTSGLLLKDAKFASEATTLSGSVSYVLTMPQQGWNVVPTLGFALTDTRTDKIRFSDGSTLAIDDAQSRVGFAGATVSRTMVAEGGKSAWTGYATATVYKDFSATTASTFQLAPDAGGNPFKPERLVSDNLGMYGELSLGVNYVRVLERQGAAAPRQINASIRVDGRTGESLDSVGITGQFRLQF